MRTQNSIKENVLQYERSDKVSSTCDLMYSNVPLISKHVLARKTRQTG